MLGSLCLYRVCKTRTRIPELRFVPVGDRHPQAQPDAVLRNELTCHEKFLDGASRSRLRSFSVEYGNSRLNQLFSAENNLSKCAAHVL